MASQSDKRRRNYLHNMSEIRIFQWQCTDCMNVKVGGSIKLGMCLSLWIGTAWLSNPLSENRAWKERCANQCVMKKYSHVVAGQPSAQNGIVIAFLALSQGFWPPQKTLPSLYVSVTHILSSVPCSFKCWKPNVESTIKWQHLKNDCYISVIFSATEGDYCGVGEVHENEVLVSYQTNYCWVIATHTTLEIDR